MNINVLLINFNVFYEDAFKNASPGYMFSYSFSYFSRGSHCPEEYFQPLFKYILVHWVHFCQFTL